MENFPVLLTASEMGGFPPATLVASQLMAAHGEMAQRVALVLEGDINLARRVIETMREPTEAMCRMSGGEYPDVGPSCWRNMIDEALA